MSRKYQVSVSYQSDRTFEECLEAELKTSNFAHNKTRSRVVSVAAAFVWLLATLFRDESCKLESFHELFAAVSCGKHDIPSKVFNKFGMMVATAIGYADIPTKEDIVYAMERIGAEYEKSNSYVTVAMIAKYGDVLPGENEGEAPIIEVEETEIGAAATV